MDELLKLLKENALESPDNLAKMLDVSVGDVKAKISEYEEKGIIRGYQAIVNEDRLDIQQVTAIIEVQVTPEKDGGFNRIAHRISAFEEVESVYLMSGVYDLLLFVRGKTLQEVAAFVSANLSTIEGVTSTATHFMLKTYKQHDLLMEKPDEYDRLKVTP